MLVLLYFELWIPALFLAVLLVGLDCLDGPVARARNEVSAFGEWLDSAVDKTSFLIVFVAMAAWGWIPGAVFWFLVSIQSVQLLAFFIYQKQNRRAPATGMMFWTGFFLVLAFLGPGELREVFWLSAMLAATNHLAFYLFPLLQFSSKQGVWKKSVQQNFIGSYFRAKWERRLLVDGPFRLWTWANAVTFFRLILGILLLDELWSQHVETAIALGSLFIFLDMMDGALARSSRSTSHGGWIFDAIVDKGIFLGVLVVLVLQGAVPFSLALVTGGRYVAIAAIATSLFFARKPFPIALWSVPANAVLALTIFFSSQTLVLLAILLQIQTFLHYFFQAFRQIKVRKNSPQISSLGL